MIAILLVSFGSCLTEFADSVGKNEVQNGRQSLFLKPLYLLQAAAQGLGGVAESYAYSLAPASVILTAKRSAAVMCAISSSSLYFKERHILVKLFVFILLAGGLILLAL